MTELKIRLPDKLHQRARKVSKMQNIPIDEIIAASLAQKTLSYHSRSYLEERAKRATGEGFSVVLSQIPDVPPEDYDRL